MARRYIQQMARELGEIAALARTSLPRLAVAVARAAQRGEVDEDDATEIYEIYIKASQPGEKVDLASGTFRANASKLRQIIKCAMLTPIGGGGGHHSHDTVALLQDVRAAHDKLCKTHECFPLYVCMVEACRMTIRQRGRHPNKAQLLKLIRKESIGG